MVDGGRVGAEHVDLRRSRHGLVVGKDRKPLDLEQHQVELRLGMGIGRVANGIPGLDVSQVIREIAAGREKALMHRIEAGEIFYPPVPGLRSRVDDEDEQRNRRCDDRRIVAQVLQSQVLQSHMAIPPDIPDDLSMTGRGLSREIAQAEIAQRISGKEMPRPKAGQG